MKTDLEITPEELLPKPPRIMEPTPRQPISTLEAILAELQRLNHAVNSLIPHVRSAVTPAIDDTAGAGMRDILGLTANYFGLSEATILSPRRHKSIVRARQTAMFLCKECTPQSYTEIAQFFRYRDHTTVMHAVSLMGELKTKDQHIAMAISTISNQIKGKANDCN